jgi:hypothetical protein
MTSPLKRPAVLAGGAVAALAVAGVVAWSVFGDRSEPAAPAAPEAPVAEAPLTPAGAPVPFEYESGTQYAEVDLKLPEALKSQPELHAALYDEAVRNLRAFSEGSQADRSEAGGDLHLGPYEKTISYGSEVETAKLFSLARTDYEFTGGAHGNGTFASVLWDKTQKAKINAGALFRSGADLAPLDNALCAAINAEKKKRDPDAETLGLASGPDTIWSCPRAAEIPFVLAEGTEAGKAGGLTFLIAPYIVGPYSDGPMEVSLGQDVIRPLLAPTYADEFAGRIKG